MPKQLAGRPLAPYMTMPSKAKNFQTASFRNYGNNSIGSATKAFGNARSSKLLDNVPGTGGVQNTAGDGGFDILSAADSVVPYLSNALNAFRKVPMPIPPAKINPLPVGRVLLDKSPLFRATAVARRNASILDGPEGQALGAAALDSQIQGSNDLAFKQVQLDADASGRTAAGKLQADAFNAGVQNQYQDEIVGAKIAQQNAQSANFANAADKYIGMRNADAMRKLDADKLKVYSKLFDRGMVDRFIVGLQAQGVKVPGEYAFGGELPGAPTVGVSKAGRSALDTDAQSRDYISSLVGAGYTDYTSEDARGLASSLKNTTGELSNGLLAYISMFNSRPDMKGLSPEARVTKFYEMGSSNPALGAYLNRMRNVGYGPAEGFRTSPNIVSRRLNGTPIFAKS